MIGRLLEWINKGVDLEDLKKHWESKTDPVIRPTTGLTANYLLSIARLRLHTAPSARSSFESAKETMSFKAAGMATGKAAERAARKSAKRSLGKFGYSPRDLQRLYLTLDQVPQSGVLWRPFDADSVEPLSSAMSSVTLVDGTQRPQNSVGNLLAEAQKSIKEAIPYAKAPVQKCTFRKFVLAILPSVLELAVLPANKIQPFFFTTGNKNAKSIIYFHKEGSHTASWYKWDTFSSPENAAMKPEWTPVQAIVSFPHMWDDFASASEALDEVKTKDFKFKREGIRYLFCVKGARETSTTRNLYLFSNERIEIKEKSNLARKTVKGYSQKGRIKQPEKGKEHVAGFQVHKGENFKLEVGVKTKTGQVSRYEITEFD